MQPIERRITALEATTQDAKPKLVLVEDGQTEAEALRQAGWPADARGVIFCNPLDVDL